MLHSQTRQSTGTDKAQTAPQLSIQLSEALLDHLRQPENVHKGRLILRSWFLSEIQKDDVGAPTMNPAPLADNVYLYELLDDFFSELLENAGSHE